MSWTDTQKSFYDSMWPLAVTAGASTGISPELIFAQGALESGWGQHAPNNNYFGIKGPGGTQTTREFVNGQWTTIQAPFRGYTSMADSVQGWVDFITGNPRYSSVIGAKGADAQLAALGSSGYATDPGYVSKLKGIIATLPQLPNIDWSSPDAVNQWLRDHTGLTDLYNHIGGAVSGATDSVKSAASGTVDEILSKIAEPLKRAGFVVLAIVVIVAGLYLMAGKQPVIVKTS